MISLLCRIEFFPPGRIDDAEDRFILLDQRYADAAVLVAPRIVGRSVNGVDDPDGLVAGNVAQVFFFAEETDFGETQAELPGEEVLDGHIGRGDDVLESTFVVYLKTPAPVHQGRCGPDNSAYNLYINRFHKCLTAS